MTLSRSLVAGNTAPAGAEVHNFTGTLYAADFNLLGHDGLTGAAAFHGFTPGGLDRTTTSDGDLPAALSAILAPVADHGGPTDTLALVVGSPAIDAVTGASCPDPTTDQRGVTRPQNGDGDAYADCDIGAYEFVKGPCPETGAHGGVGRDGEDPAAGEGGALRTCGSDGHGRLEPDIGSARRMGASERHRYGRRERRGLSPAPIVVTIARVSGSAGGHAVHALNGRLRR